MKTNKKWLPATLRNLCVVCLHFLFDEELFSGIHYKMYFRCLETMLRILCFVKLFICRRRFGGNMPSSSIDRQHHRMKTVTVGTVVGGRGELQGHC